MSALTMDTLAVWRRAVEDPQLNDLPYKVETNEYGQLVLSPTSLSHSEYQSQIHALLLDALRDRGSILEEVAVETCSGVKVPDVAWISSERRATFSDDVYAMPVAPELCIEVISPRNTHPEMESKRRVYFEQGAEEVWTCDREGRMRFFDPGGELEASRLVPGFPRQVRRTGA